MRPSTSTVPPFLSIGVVPTPVRDVTRGLGRVPSVTARARVWRPVYTCGVCRCAWREDRPPSE